MKRRVAALLMVVGFMLAKAAPAFAQERRPGACDPNPGLSEGSASPWVTPLIGVPDVIIRHSTANEHNLPGHDDGLTGRGRSVIECST
jgi:hypothetical protein